MSQVEEALRQLARGRPTVVLDAQDRENEADLIVAADAITEEQMGLFVRYTSGVVCVAVAGERADALALPPMVAVSADSMRTAFTVSVDAATGVTTGISAADRARTVRLLADPACGPDDLVRPGHVFPLRARDGGVLERPGHTEAAFDLARLAGREPAGALSELVDDAGRPLRADAAAAFAERHGLAVISIADLAAYRRRTERLLTREVSVTLPTHEGGWTAHGYSSSVDGTGYLALVAGDPAADPGADVLVRVHSECLTGDVFGSLRCDCGPQLDEAMRMVQAAGAGVVIYVRGHEGRGIGLLKKLSAYVLQDDGRDTVDANLALGLPADARDYWVAAQILRDLEVGRVRLLTNNPAKQAGLEMYGIDVTGCAPLLAGVDPVNLGYLRTKRERLGHAIPPKVVAP